VAKKTKFFSPFEGATIEREKKGDANFQRLRKSLVYKDLFVFGLKKEKKKKIR